METQFSDGQTDMQYPNGFGALGSGDLSPPPPTTLTEAFVAAQTKVLCQILQAQQRMAQQLQQLQPMQQDPRPFKPCSPRVPTQTDINAIVGAIQMLEGQKFSAESDNVRYHPRTLWGAISN
jgi:hypothetical protein